MWQQPYFKQEWLDTGYILYTNGWPIIDSFLIMAMVYGWHKFILMMIACEKPVIFAFSLTELYSNKYIYLQLLSKTQYESGIFSDYIHQFVHSYYCKVYIHSEKSFARLILFYSRNFWQQNWEQFVIYINSYCIYIGDLCLQLWLK